MENDVSHEQSQEFIANFVRTFPFKHLSSQSAQKFITNPEYYCNQFTEIITGKGEVVKKKFGYDILLGEGIFKVPTNYNHETQVDTFGEKTRNLKSTFHYSDFLTSDNFAKATNKLIPEETYIISFFPVLEKVQGKECLAFLKEKDAILVGTQGLMALQNHQPEIFPIEKQVFSFDEKDALLRNIDVGYMMLFVKKGSSEGNWVFGLSLFDFYLFPGDILVCFCYPNVSRNLTFF